MSHSDAGPITALAHGWIRMRRESKDATTHKLVTLHAQGLTDAQIAAELKCSSEAARKRRTKLGLPVVPAQLGRRPARDLDAEVTRLFGEGHGYLQIAITLGLTRTGVQQRCRRLGLKRNAYPAVRAGMESTRPTEPQASPDDIRVGDSPGCWI